MRRKVTSIAGIVLLLLLAGCIVLSIMAAFRNDKVVLTYAEVNPLDGTIVGAMAKAFKEKTEELSGGNVVIDIQAGGVLGSEDQVLDNLLGGGNMADLCRVSALALTQYGCGKASLLSVPYTFVNEEHFWNFAASDLASEILMEPHDIGLPMRGLCYGEEGFRHFFLTKEASGLSDLKGRKLRVSADPVMTGTVGNLGASATTVSFTELYSALSTGVVDGAEQPLSNYCSNAFYEVAPYLMLDGHTLGAVQILISDFTWEKLTEEQRGWIQEAASYATQVCRENVSAIEEENFKLLQDEGVQIIEVEDKAPWVEACQPTIKMATAGYEDVYQQIVDMQTKD